jgi:predicted HNH restriction endonuclease
MAKKEITADMIRLAYLDYLQQIRRYDPEAFANFTEKKLTEFIRKYDNAAFASIYACTDHNFYDRVRNKIATNGEMRAEDDAIGQQFSVHLRTYSNFLESKTFKQLFKLKSNSGDAASSSKPAATSQTPSTPKERQMTEGERKHVEQEREVVKRNPLLRQACIDKYGYQCQCCGMNFADVYGEVLGSRFIEVHHLKMISTYDEQLPDDYLENLVPLCSNCHSMIHHGLNGPLTLRELRDAYKGEKKEIKVWKED